MCIFCKIAAGEIPCTKIYEDEYTLAFADIAPINPGHTLVITKNHYQQFLALPEELACRLIIAVSAVSEILAKEFQPDGFNIMTNVNEAAGQSVTHCHFHIIPRYWNDGKKTMLDNQ